MSATDLPASAVIGRVALRVADVESVAEFYETVVGLERLPSAAAPPRTDPDATDVVLGVDETPLLVLLHAPDAPPRDERAAGLYHTAVRVPDRAALGSAIERIRDAGQLDGAADHLVSEAVYLSDPEGNGVEVYADRPREEWTFVRPPAEGPEDDASDRSAGSDRVRIDTLPLDLDALLAASDGRGRAPAGTDVGHVHLEVTDLTDAWRFYVDSLGMNVRETVGDDALFVAAGDYHHHVGLNTWQHRDRPAGVTTNGASQATRGLAWFEVTLPEEAALDAATQRLENAGYDVARTGEVDSTTATAAAIVDDPDGIELRLRVAAE